MLLYRYESCNSPYEHSINLVEYLVVKDTPCGYWYIDKRNYFGQNLDDFIKDNKKWTSKTARVRKCYPTKEEALNSFRIRCNRRIIYLERDLIIARQNLQLLETMTSL